MHVQPGGWQADSTRFHLSMGQRLKHILRLDVYISIYLRHEEHRRRCIRDPFSIVVTRVFTRDLRKSRVCLFKFQ